MRVLAAAIAFVSLVACSTTAQHPAAATLDSVVKIEFARKDGRGLCSGVVIEQRGTILTNKHCVEGASKHVVTLHDGRKFDARVIGLSNKTDIAALGIDAGRLQPIEIGNSDELNVGDEVFAIGMPFGLAWTVTRGIVSFIGRDIRGFGKLVQIDASVNPGNSGGALINARGELVGINSAVFSPHGASVGLNFAIAINDALEALRELS